MRHRLNRFLALAAALSGCSGQHVPGTSRHLPAAVATPPSDAALLRVSRTGGNAQLLRANSLTARDWIIPGGLPTMARILGAGSGEDQTVYGADNTGRLVLIDLKGQRSRVVPTTARDLVAAFDGTILGIDSARRPVRFNGASGTAFKATVEKGTTLFRGPGDQILAVGNRPGQLQVLAAAGEVRHLPIPAGAVTATWVGDLVAVTTDSGVLFVDPSGKPPSRRAAPRFLKLRGTPVVSAFSPSGHRLYVSRKTGGLAMVDRFTHNLLRELPLPEPVAALRADRTGRWLLARAASGDSVWAVDLSRWAVAWSGTAPWAEDLPQVVAGQTLLTRRKTDLLAIDLAGAVPPERGMLAGGAGDLYLMLPWVPRASGQAATEVAATGTPPAGNSAVPTARPDSAAPPPAAVKPPPSNAATGGKTYIQVSASQNHDFAKALADQLKDGGFPATVLERKTNDEAYRVVVGPYLTREDADAVGKRLGRSYFIVTPD